MSSALGFAKYFIKNGLNENGNTFDGNVNYPPLKPKRVLKRGLGENTGYLGILQVWLTTLSLTNRLRYFGQHTCGRSS